MAGVAAVKATSVHEYGVFIDGQGVSYLRVGSTAKGGLFILNTGKSVELIEMPEDTISSRGLEKVTGVDLIAAARQGLHPLSKSVVVSKRAEVELQKILNNQEIINMAVKVGTSKTAAVAAAPAAAPAPTGKVKVGVKKAPVVAPAAPAAAPVAVAAPKAVKAPKAPKAVAPPAAAPEATEEANGAGRGRPSQADRQLVVLKRAKLVEGEKVPPQALAIINLLQESGKKLTVAQIVAGLEGRVESRNVLGLKDVWNMNRKRLIDQGFIEVQLLAS